MRISPDRILTTHTGSLPRSAELSDLLLRKDHDEEVDAAALDRVIRESVADNVARQAAIGIDIVSDGEASKVNYATYIHERLSGFEGDQPRKPALDLAGHPEFRERLARVSGRQTFRRSCCTGPVAVQDRRQVRKDLANLREATSKTRVIEAFMNAASPGLITAFQPNQFYPSHRAYVEAVAKAMKEEYEAIVAAGFILQVDCPDLAMARHTGFQDLSEAEFLKRADVHVDALNEALSQIPSDMVRMHVCWGNYEGPHDHDIPLEKIISILLRAKPRAILFEAANPRHQHEWVVWRDARIPEDKVLVPGLIEPCSATVEHPELVAQRITQFTEIVGRDRVIAGTDCGFGTFAGMGKLEPEMIYKKLRSLVEGAAIASGRLWKRTFARARYAN
ncbi:MAG: cobalamin-independent methionine synthase II family protein [Acidobacteriota bacterium]|nr:cobalamin-independent methionine synthase II family protein [Acidobacteriota bacterium]